MDDIADKTLQALGFHIFATGYLEKESSRFIDVTDLELTAKPDVLDNPNQVITDSKEKMVKKKNECAAKRKKQLAKLRTPIGSSSSPRPKFSLLSLPCSMPTSVPALVPALVLALVPAFVPVAPMSASFSCLGSPVNFLSGRVPALVAVSCRAFMPPVSVLSPFLPLRPLPLRTFKQSLSDEPRPRVSISPAKPLCPFLALGALDLYNNNGLYNPTNKNNRKRDFDIVFINSCLLANKHDQKEVDLSFTGCGCPLS